MEEEYLLNCWYVAGWDSELAEGQFQAVTICDVPLLVYRTSDGEIVVLEDRCCHRMAPLSKGRLEDGCNVRCMYHGLKFDSSGQCIEIPGQDVIPPAACVRRFAAVVRYDWIWVWMGDAGSADEALLPYTPHTDRDDLIYRHGQIDYDANYELVNDNLTDFTHLAFVHGNSFMATEAWAHKRPTVKPIERGIRVTRWFRPEEAPLKAEAQSGDRVSGSLADLAMFQSYDYLAPGILLMYSAFFDPEMMPADGVSRPEAKPMGLRVDLQAVTPMSSRRTRYFFRSGVRAGEGGEAMADRTKAVTEMAFAEDREMIEAQQQILDGRPGREVLISSDVGPVQFRSVLRKLRSAERELRPAEPETA